MNEAAPEAAALTTSVRAGKVLVGLLLVGFAGTLTWQSEPVGWASHPNWQLEARTDLVERAGRRTLVFSGRRLYRLATVNVPSGFRFVRSNLRTNSELALVFDIAPSARLGWRNITFFDGAGNDIVCRRCIFLVETGALRTCPPKAGRVNFWGTNGNDHITGTEGRDQICGLGGHDTLIGGDAADLMWGNDGYDALYGENGNDTLFGGSSPDFVNGGPGGDVLTGGMHGDRIHGSSGDDIVNARDGYRDSVNGGTGSDRCRTDRYDDRASC